MHALPRRLTRRVHAACALLAGSLLLSCAAHAASLQVSPVSLTIGQGQPAEGLWLSNNGERIVHAQVRVFRWLQPDGQDQLEDTQDIVISPPYLQIEPGKRQLIRVIRAGEVSRAAGTSAAGAAARAATDGPAIEQAYRLIVDELPVASGGNKGIQFVMRYSVPVFVQPGGQPAAPALQWRIQATGGKPMLAVSNSGGTHVQLADVSLRGTSSETVVVRKGLLGYVLPGMTMYWPMPAALRGVADHYTIEALLNGVATKGIRPARTPPR